MKMITGQKTSANQQLRGLANLHNDGNMKELATSVNIFFQQVAADLCRLDDDITPPSPDHILAEFTINQAQVERKLSEINIYKASGPDGLPIWLLRDFSAQLAGSVCAIYNASVCEGFVPFRWKEANLIPVSKVHPPRSIESDLRPISLTATLAKLVESFVGSWILE